jgi:hypothetical protein
MKNFVNVFSTLAIGVLLLGFSMGTQAVPSYARQTGMPCAVCHTNYPELTPFGRSFKLNGYTLTGLQQIQSEPGSGQAGLRINAVPPLSAMLQLSTTSMNKSDPAIQNHSVGFPQEASLFFAGEIADHLGTFLQMTYAQDTGKLSWDNTDVRYANHADTTIWGITLNNNPTVQDIWNSTPAWGFPFSSSAAANTPAAATLVDGTLAQDVGGVGAYAMWANQFYTELTVYRSAHQGEAAPSPASLNTIDGVAPYWRLAWQNNFGLNYLMVGAYGLMADLFPSGITGTTDKIKDAALDAQYERSFGGDNLTVRSTYIREKKVLDATFAAGGSSNDSDTLSTSRVNGSYHFGGKYTASLAHFRTTGSNDALLFPSSALNGSPDSSGEIAQFTYLPWQNVQVTAQYTLYDKFDGAKSNYNGAGRNAADNNTLYFLLWLIY